MSKTPKNYTKEFEEFWNNYPFRRGSKYDAFRAFEKVVGRIVQASEITSAARRFSAIVEREKKDPKFVPHAATWINGRRWETIEDLEHEHQCSTELARTGGTTKGNQTPEQFTESSVAEWIRLFDDNTVSRHTQKVLSCSGLSLGAGPE